MKKAYLIHFGFSTRIIANENTDEGTIADLAIDKIMESGARNYLADGLEEIINDEEVPFGSLYEDKEK